MKSFEKRLDLLWKDSDVMYNIGIDIQQKTGARSTRYAINDKTFNQELILEASLTE